MSKRNSIILGMLFIILVVEIVIFAPKELGLSPEDDRAPTPSQQVAGEQPGGNGQVMSDVYSIEAKGEAKEWELWADKALGPRNNTDEWTIKNVRVKFYASNGVSYNVTGKTGHVVPMRNDIRIEGNVVTKSSNGYVFKTESAFYESGPRKLTSPNQVEMSGPPDKEGGPLHLTGGELLANLNTNEININRSVKARKTVKKDRVATIQSSRAEFSGRTNSAHFIGDVIMDVDTMRVTGPEAKFIYNTGTKALDAVDILGGVKVTDTDKYATSKMVNVNFRDDRTIFNGAPRVVQNGDELTGDQIVFLDGGRKVQVSNAKADFDPEKVREMEKKE